MKKLLIPGFAMILLLALVLGACTSSSSTSTPTSPGTTPSSSSTTVSSSGGTTAGLLAADGQAVFSANCARCHGNNGQGGTGPTIIGSGQSLDKYSTAQGLYNFISTVMPANAPGSLSSQQYLQVTAFLLLQNSVVSSGQAMDSGSLGSISLAK